MSDSQGEERDQTQFNSREVRHHQADKGDNLLLRGLKMKLFPGSCRVLHLLTIIA